MVKNKNLIPAFGLIIVLLTYFVLATAGDGVRILAPSSGSNYVSINSVAFSVAYVNGSDITTPTNATFFINLSTGWARIGDATSCTSIACTTAITNLTIPD